MKALKFLLLLIIPVMLSCNSQPSNRQSLNETTDDTDDKYRANPATGMGARSNDMEVDEDFIREAASGGMMEVELGRYAQQNAQNPRVKQFGAMMVRNHSKVNEELREIASGKNVTISDLEDSHRRKMTDLQKKSGEDFDEAYIKEMVDDHEKDVDKFKKLAENGKDPDLKAFAAKTLPVLLMHLDSAKSIREDINR